MKTWEYYEKDGGAGSGGGGGVQRRGKLCDLIVSDDESWAATWVADTMKVMRQSNRGRRNGEEEVEEEEEEEEEEEYLRKRIVWFCSIQERLSAERKRIKNSREESSEKRAR